MIGKLKRWLCRGLGEGRVSPVPAVTTSQQALDRVRHDIFHRRLTLQSVPADLYALEDVRQRLALIDSTLQSLGPTCGGRKHIEKLKAVAKVDEMRLELRLGILGPQKGRGAGA